MAIIFLAAHIGTKSCNEINDVIAFLKSTKLNKLNKICIRTRISSMASFFAIFEKNHQDALYVDGMCYVFYWIYRKYCLKCNYTL